MLIFKTSKETLFKVIVHAKHALMVQPQFEPGEIILIAQTRDELAEGELPIRYRMEIRRVYEDRDGESEQIFGHKWRYIVEGYNCFALKTPFDISEVQVTRENYRQGGTICHVAPRDAEAIVLGGHLEISP